MNSMHDAVQSRNGPAEAAANGERNADGDVGLALLRGYGRRPPSTRTVSGAGTGVAEVCHSLSVGSYIYLFITENNLTEFVSFILTQCGINIKRKVVLLLDLLF